MKNQQIKLLFVDDDRVTRYALQAYFEDEDYDVSLAKSAEEAIELVKDKPIQLCVVDMRLPTMDGNELIQYIYNINSSMKFIIFTGSTNYQLPPELLELGISMDDVMTKPVQDLSILEKKIIASISDL